MKYGLDQLIRSLKDKSQVVIDQYHQETDRQAADLKRQLLEESTMKYEHQKQRLIDQAHQQQERQIAAYSAQSNQEVLQYKFQLIEELIDEVEADFLQMDDDQFRSFFNQYCAVHRNIIKVKTIEKRQAVIAEIIAENKYRMELEIDTEMVDGFILMTKHIDYNYEFDKLFDYYHDHLVEFVREGLFNE